MPLEPGSHLGPYEILRLVGTGGMGEVYAARDTRLDREVAIKVLPESIAADADALARFEREARAVAALAHPNIVALYDLDRADGRAYAAMELLEGESLRERLERGPIPPRKAIVLARQIARGLGAAHDRGIVHRDLKPDNIFLTGDGQAKILDFGLAVDRRGAADATRTSLTAPGAVMGTVGYMAPEQVRGEPVDHRADVFAFGSVLFEMLSGHRAFARDTAAETMTAILREEPGELKAASGPISPALERVVHRCLEKNRDERFQSARDLAFAIDNAGGPGSSDSGGAIGAGASDAAATAAAALDLGGTGVSGRRFRWVAALVVATALAGIAGFLVGRGIGGRSPAPGVVADPVRIRTLSTSGRDSEPTASPDGRLFAFRSTRDGTSRIWIRQMAGGGEQPVTVGSDSSPRFSPDGSTLLFLRDEGGVQSVYRQALVGGQAKKLVEDAIDASWSPDGEQIVFVRLRRDAEGHQDSRLGIADARDGTERILTEIDAFLSGVRWSPDGRSVLGVQGSITGNNPDSALVRIDVADGSVELLRPDSDGFPLTGPAFVSRGEVTLGIAGSLLGDQGDPLSRIVRFDLATGETETLLWAENIFPLQGLRAAFSTLDVLAPGALLFHRVATRQILREQELPEDGANPPGDLRILTRGQSRDRQPIYSPDGHRIAFSSSRSGNLDLWTVDRATGALRQLTDDAAQDWDPAFTPDGQQLLWSSDRSGHLEIWIANADGSGARQLSHDGVDAENPTVTADGAWVIYWSANPEKEGVWKMRIDGSEPTRLVSGSYLQPDVSPDGRYAAFLSINAGTVFSKIHVVDVAGGELLPFEIEVESPVQDAGRLILGRLRWMPSGERLAYVGVDERGRTGIYVQDFAPDRDTSATRRPLAGFSSEFLTESFGVSRDGRRIAIATQEETYDVMLAEGVPGIARPR